MLAARFYTHRSLHSLFARVVAPLAAADSYVQLKKKEHYATLCSQWNAAKDGTVEDGRIFYLSIPPFAYEDTAAWINAHCMPASQPAPLSPPSRRRLCLVHSCVCVRVRVRVCVRVRVGACVCGCVGSPVAPPNVTTMRNPRVPRRYRHRRPRGRTASSPTLAPLVQCRSCVCRAFTVTLPTATAGREEGRRQALYPRRLRKAVWLRSRLGQGAGGGAQEVAPRRGDLPCGPLPWQVGGTRREPFNSTPMGVNSIFFGPPHVRCTPVGRTCGEPNEIKKIPTRKMLRLFFFVFR